MTIIGLSGYAGSGKDEFASVLVRNHGYTRIAFADVLRDVAYAADPYVHTYDYTPPVEWAGEGLVGVTRLRAVIDAHGWDYAKNEFDDVRRLLQRLGTEAGRDILGENVWVNAAFDRAPNDKIVITDVRFPNELQAVAERGGVTVRIDRPGVGPRNDHASERSLDNARFDWYYVNNGTLDMMAADIDYYIERGYL